MINPEDALLHELLQTFAVEAAEHLQTLNQSLLQLERVSDAQRGQELLQEAFRAAHSLKGSARTVGIKDIEGLAAAIESILQSARDEKLTLDPAICDVLYDTLDIGKRLLEGEVVELAEIYARLAGIGTSLPVGETLVSETPVVEDTPAAYIPTEATIRVAVNKLDNLMAQAGELIISRISAEQRVVEVRQIKQHLTHWTRTWRDVKTLLPRLNGEAKHQLADLLTHHNDQIQTFMRDMNALHQNISHDTLRLEMATTHLQDEVRLVRMVPFQNLELTLQRVVRDAARSEGKQVSLHIEGSEVEVDKKVLETLKDPLLHLLRNAVSHGIETPDQRQAAGKPIAGSVNLIVQQRGSDVRITVCDDGRGFDLDGLRRAGGNHGHPTLDEKASNDEVIALAFLSGVTTSPEVTPIAGRGVGLDVVRQCLDVLQGRIFVDSKPGEGSSIQLVVPVSLAMTRGLLVLVGNEHYAIPLLTVEKIVEPSEVYSLEGQAMITVDGKPLPLIPLASLLKRSAGADNNTLTPLVVVMLVAEQRLALLVDDVLTEQELAVKPLGQLLQQVPNVSGAALLSNGDPVIVLNAADLMKSARGIRVSPFKNGHKKQEVEVKPERIQILVVDDSITTRTLEKNILEAAGFEVFTATDGLGALRQLKGNAVQLVVSDVQMPNMDGIALVTHLRESAEYKMLPIILVTSLESQQDRERGLVAGANAYIVKRGFDQADLLSTIRQLL